MKLHGLLFEALLEETDVSREDADEFVRSWLTQLRDDGVVIAGDDE
jgi:hypothetical protein